MIRQFMMVAAALSAVLLTGCASIVNGQQQSVSVTTQSKDAELQGAKCSLSNDKGTWYLTSPGSATVHRSYNELKVSCSMAGQPVGSTAAKSSTTGAVFGNVLVGGVIGAGIDVATGAAYSYPNLIPVTMGQDTRLDVKSGSDTAGGAPPDTVAMPATPDTKVPFISERGQQMYRDYLTKQSPRAFAVSSNGHWGRAWTTQEPGKRTPPDDTQRRAMENCNRDGAVGCRLYSIDAQVFVAAPAAPASPAATTPPVAATTSAPVPATRAVETAVN